MASIIINSSCNLRCPFCFATESRSTEEQSTQNMDSEEFNKILKFDSNIVTTICGGEPTIHPNFREFMDNMLAVRGKYINLLTNGIWPQEVCEYIKSLPFEKSKRIVYLFNILEPHLYTEKQLTRIHAALSSINPETAFVGFTIYKNPFDYSFIFDIARQYKISRIRYSVAAPNVTDENSWNIEPEKDFRDSAKTVYSFVKDAAKQGFEVNPDCGYLPPCAYTKEELAELLLIQPGVKFKCTAVADIGKGGESWRCYSLYSTIKANINDFSSIGELTEFYEKRSELLLNIDMFDKCKDCEYKISDICHGGCLGYRIIKGLKQDKDYKFFPIDSEEQFMESVPSINHKTLKVWKKNTEETYVYIRRNWQMQTKTLQSDKNLIDFIEVCDGERTVRQIIDKLLDGVNDYEASRNRIVDMIKNLHNQDAIKIRS